MEFEILPEEKAEGLRQSFINAFIDTTGDHYQEHIAKRRQYPDGCFYDGYLWDCLKDNRNYEKECSIETAVAALAKKEKVLVMWDLFSTYRVRDFRRFSISYPRNTILRMSGSVLAKQVVEEWEKDQSVQDQALWFPEDIYCFDETLRWYVIFTHEGWDQWSRPELSEDDYIRICFCHET